MIKTHRVTGLKYLCYTRKTGKDFDKYLGSGLKWKQHLLEHGEHVDTEVIFSTEDLDEFKRVALEKSSEFDVVNSDQWANMKPEEGDGGDTVSNKMWITDGTVDRYILKTDSIPDGWRKGRGSKCVFNNRAKQKEFNSRVDARARGVKIKEAWDSGRVVRDHSKCGRKGVDNPACRPEVRKKISDSAKARSKALSERIKLVKPWLKSPRSTPCNETDTQS